MTTESDFVAAIVAAPDDDALRLIYSDFLEEHGQEDRAAFIRLEVAKAATGFLGCPEPHPGASVGCGECAYCRLDIATERFHETKCLWDAVTQGNNFGQVGYAHTSRHHTTFKDASRWPTLYTWRGCVDRIEITCEGWLATGPAVMRALDKGMPLRTVRLTDKRPARALSDGSRWRWFGAAVEPLSHDELPDDIFDVTCGRMNGGYLMKSEQEAYDLLSEGCMRWARQQTP